MEEKSGLHKVVVVARGVRISIETKYPESSGDK